jgi:hypothetical protein
MYRAPTAAKEKASPLKGVGCRRQGWTCSLCWHKGSAAWKKDDQEHRLKPVLLMAQLWLVAVLEGNVFVGDFWAWRAGGESVVGVTGLFVLFGVSCACTGACASGHAAAFATSA